MNGRTWKNQSLESLQKIKLQLLAIGGIVTEVKNKHEIWRIRIADAVFIAFKSGTLYHTPSNTDSVKVSAASMEIDSIIGSGYVSPTKDCLIGLDETGKGEIVGPVVLVGIIFPKHLFEDFVTLIGPADTKKQQRISYWNELFVKLNQYRENGFNFIAEKISPNLFDYYNVNDLLDLFYQKITLRLLRTAPSEGSRIILDDYGVGADFKKIFKSDNRNELLVLTKAEDQFIEAKIASLISKKIRENIINQIDKIPEYQLDRLTIGRGNVANPQTREWLTQWFDQGRPWPWFIKKSFKTIRDLEGQTGKSNKKHPTLKTDLLPADFNTSFEQSNAPINLSSIKCENCHQLQHIIIYDFHQLICSSCSKPIIDLQLTLRYYCGSISIDHTILKQRALNKDLAFNCLFENYNVIVPLEDSAKENPDINEGLKELKQLESLGRIDLQYFKINAAMADDSENIYSAILKETIKSQSILLTSDKQLQDRAKKQNIFTIFLKDKYGNN